MVDEIDLMQPESNYRPSLEKVIPTGENPLKIEIKMTLIPKKRKIY